MQKISHKILDNCTKENRKILDDYWLFDKNKPMFKVAELLDKYNLSQRELTKIVRENSFAKRDDYKCSICQYEVIFKSRTSAIFPTYVQNNISRYNSSRGMCYQCIEKIDRENAILIQKQRAEEIERQIERNQTIPHSMYDGWEPELTDEDIIDQFDVEMRVVYLTKLFVQFYKPKKHIKYVTRVWNKKFFKHCERHANWKKEKAMTTTNTA